jgi:3-oxoacyl-[acyl-carrier-protein] synthase II
MTAPDVDGPRRAMQIALRHAGLTGADVDYVNAHGTSTPLGDVNETNAIKVALGEDAARNLVISSTKSMTGHLLGGAGGIEMVFTALAVHHQVVPPTINLDTPGEGCDLDYCPHTARDLHIEVANELPGDRGGVLSLRSLVYAAGDGEDRPVLDWHWRALFF